MVFKVVGGVTSHVIDQLWSSPDTLAEDIDAALDTTSAYQGLYKNRFVQNWQTFNPREVSRHENGTENIAITDAKRLNKKAVDLRIKLEIKQYKGHDDKYKAFGVNNIRPQFRIA